jgi:hypothetical protein
MHKLTITGASDDLVEIDGDISEEFNWTAAGDDDTEQRFLAVSDGTLLRVRYDEDGIWRLTTVVQGSSAAEKIEGVAADDTNDVVTLEQPDPFAWVVFGDAVAK